MTDQGSALRLRLEGDALLFIASVGGASQRIEGSVSSIRNALGSGNLTEAKVESAIAQIEDLIMPIIRALPASERFEIDGAELVEVIELLSDDHQAVISIESVEGLFNQLVNYVSGSPSAWRQPIPATRVVLGLVVLREVMHHGGFSTVRPLHHAE